MIHIFI